MIDVPAKIVYQKQSLFASEGGGYPLKKMKMGGIFTCGRVGEKIVATMIVATAPARFAGDRAKKIRLVICQNGSFA
jgi:hypothetical protein